MHAAADGATAWAIMQKQRVNVAIVDLMLPDHQGWHLVQNIRRQASLPILVISALDDLDRRVKLLQSGADDYLTKPFAPRELLARIEAVVRRLAPWPQEGTTDIPFGPYRVYLDHKTCYRGQERVALTTSELTLLEALITNPGRIFSREQLLARLHGWDDGTLTLRVVDVHIASLRAKLEPDPKRPRWIETVWGVGYRFRRDDQ